MNAAGNVIGPLGASPNKSIEGTPLPGGGCYYTLPGGNTVTRLDSDCDGMPSPAAMMRGGNSALAGGTRSADSHGDQIRQLIMRPPPSLPPFAPPSDGLNKRLASAYEARAWKDQR